MIKPINLFLLSRINDVDSFKSIILHDCIEKDDCDELKIKYKEHEINSLRKLVDALVELGCDIQCWDGYFFSYIIPQIGKEFDLLKFSTDKVLNIELKCTDVEDEKIEKQLDQNRHYLRHLGKEIFSYTVVTNTMKCYKMQDDGTLNVVQIEELADIVKQFNVVYCSNIDEMFEPSMFLISPFNTPKEFWNNQYFLTDHQEKIKKDILLCAYDREKGFFSITGKPGTGKTLLVYDIAKTFAYNLKVLIVHCGILCDSVQFLNDCCANFKIMAIKELMKNIDIVKRYKVIILDETQRIYPDQFEKICNFIKSFNKICIISIDPNQVLSLKEKNYDIESLVNNLPSIKKYNLTTKIRTNKELATFIRYVRNINKKPPSNIHFKNVIVCYADNSEEASKIIEYWKTKGYVFINYTSSNSHKITFDNYKGDCCTHRVIGQEFDNIIIVLDNTFYYSTNGELSATGHPAGYSFSRMFYQNITRVKNKIALLVVENQDVFNKIVKIFDC